MSKLPRLPIALLQSSQDEELTALEVLKRSDVPTEDRMKTVLRDGMIPGHVLREFYIWCIDRAQALVDDRNTRSIAALEVKRRWIKGEATDDELRVAGRAVCDTHAYIAASFSARVAPWNAYISTGQVTGANAIYETAESATRAAQVSHLIALLEAYEVAQ